jgi:hypothetical protein
VCFTTSGGLASLRSSEISSQFILLSSELSDTTRFFSLFTAEI